MEITDGIDIAAYSVAHSQNQVLQDVGTGILSKTLDMAELQGAQLAKMMEQSVLPHLGGNIDILL